MITLEWLKDNCEKIHFFGLGFIQIKINDGLRFHFYTDKFTPVCGGSIHTHRYTFTSEVLAGSLRQNIFLGLAGVDYSKSLHSCQADCGSVDEGLHSLKLLLSETYSKGSHYTLGRDTIHNVSSPNGCITRLTWEGGKRDHCSVYAPYGQDDGNPFVYIPEEQLWKVVEDMINEYFN